MKAYLIDPFAKNISEVEYDGNYESIYQLISSETNPVRTFTTMKVNENGDVLYLDDEGLLGNMDTQQFFVVGGYSFAGKGLVLGTDKEGYSVNPFVSFEKFVKETEIMFPTDEQTQRYKEQQLYGVF